MTTLDWRVNALAATRGTRFGAMIQEALRCVSRLPDGTSRDQSPPRFVGHATRTSDGFLMCNYISREGDYHMGAFVGSEADLDGNVAGLIRHLSMDEANAADFRAVMKGWVR